MGSVESWDADEAVAFEDMFDIAELQRFQERFSEACGVAALITRPDGTPITGPSGFCDLCTLIRTSPEGLRNCMHSDATLGGYNASGPTIRPCLSAGLRGAGASITVAGRHVANWIIGQVRNDGQSDAEVTSYARRIGVDEDAYRAAYLRVPTMSPRQFEAIAEFLFTLANQIAATAYQNVQQARYIAAQRKAEEQVRRLNQELERRVAERTAELETANRELEAFSYSVSHDLRAPLRVMDGFVRVLSEDYGPLLDDEGRRACSVVSREARKMTALVDGLLGLSRLDRRPLERRELDMASMARAAYESGTSPKDRERIRLRIDPMPEAVGDPTLIGQVWANLLGNAVKYSGKRELALIRAGGEPKNGENAYWVEDNGVGFDMRYAERVFGAFQRLHSSSEFEGEGLGLAIARTIVRKHGGRVWAHGEPGKGATFYFSLPAETQRAG